MNGSITHPFDRLRVNCFSLTHKYYGQGRFSEESVFPIMDSLATQMILDKNYRKIHLLQSIMELSISTSKNIYKQNGLLLYTIL